jgi:hypothetical protein
MRSTPVSVLCTVTVAPTTAAPLVSVTVPRIVPRNVCARLVVAAPSNIASNAAHVIVARTPHRRKVFIALS